MFTGFHWFDIVVPLLFLALLVGGLIVLGRAIGSGYARARNRTTPQPPTPSPAAPHEPPM